MYLSREQEMQEVDKKMTGVFNVWKQGKYKRKSVCFIHDKKNTRLMNMGK